MKIQKLLINVKHYIKFSIALLGAKIDLQKSIIRNRDLTPPIARASVEKATGKVNLYGNKISPRNSTVITRAMAEDKARDEHYQGYDASQNAKTSWMSGQVTPEQGHVNAVRQENSRTNYEARSASAAARKDQKKVDSGNAMQNKGNNQYQGYIPKYKNLQIKQSQHTIGQSKEQQMTKFLYQGAKW